MHIWQPCIGIKIKSAALAVDEFGAGGDSNLRAARHEPVIVREGLCARSGGRC